MAVGCFNPVLSPLVPSPPRSRLRAALRSHSHQPTAVSLRLLPSGAAAGRGTWRLAAAAESQAVQEQQARTEEPGEAGGPGAAEASSKLVLVVGGTGGVGEIPIYLMFVLLLPLRSIFPEAKISCRITAPRQKSSFTSEFDNILVPVTVFETCEILIIGGLRITCLCCIASLQRYVFSNLCSCVLP
jgi:hypothetical protein